MFINQNFMKRNDLLECKGMYFTATISGERVVGQIQVVDDRVFLCQNKIAGGSTNDKLGYKCSWFVESGIKQNLQGNSVTDFMGHENANFVQTYKDWQVGDVIEDHADTMTVIFRSGEFVACKDEDGDCQCFTAEELFDRNYRLVLPERELKAEAKASTYSDPVEVSIEEIAKWKGVRPGQIHIRKQTLAEALVEVNRDIDRMIFGGPFNRRRI